MISTLKKQPLRPAGGYVIADGCKATPNLKYRERKPWLKAVRSFLKRKVKAGDAEVIRMLTDAESEWLTFEAKPFHHWPTLTPTQKVQMLLAHILRQGREPKPTQSFVWGHGWERRRITTLDILAVGIAADLQVTYGNVPLRSPYYRAVQIGRAVRHLLNPEVRTYEREDMRTGEIVKTRVRLTKPVRVRSRAFCQRLERNLKSHAAWFIERCGAGLAVKVLTPRSSSRRLRRQADLIDN